jgi:hypothetical protein
VHYTAHPPAEVDDRAFAPDTRSVEKVPPVGENAAYCSTFLAMRTRLVRLVKYADLVVLYARRQDERERMIAGVGRAVEGFTAMSRVPMMQTEMQMEAGEDGGPHLRTIAAHNQGGSDGQQQQQPDGGLPLDFPFDLPPPSAHLAAQHASVQRTVLKDWLAGLPGSMALDESRMFAEEVARTHGGVSAIAVTVAAPSVLGAAASSVGEQVSAPAHGAFGESVPPTTPTARGRMSKNGEACLRHPEMIAQQCELVVMVQSAILRWHLPLLKRDTKAWDEVRVDFPFICWFGG